MLEWKSAVPIGIEDDNHEDQTGTDSEEDFGETFFGETGFGRFELNDFVCVLAGHVMQLSVKEDIFEIELLVGAVQREKLVELNVTLGIESSIAGHFGQIDDPFIKKEGLRVFH